MVTWLKSVPPRGQLSLKARRVGCVLKTQRPAGACPAGLSRHSLKQAHLGSQSEAFTSHIYAVESHRRASSWRVT